MVAALPNRTRTRHLLGVVAATLALAASGLLLPTTFDAQAVAAPGGGQSGEGTKVAEPATNANSGVVTDPSHEVITSGEQVAEPPAKPPTSETEPPPDKSQPTTGQSKPDKPARKPGYVFIPGMKEPIPRAKYEQMEEEYEEQKNSSCGHGITSSITNHLSVSCMTEEAVKTIFGIPKDQLLAKGLLTGILKIPDFVNTPSHQIYDAERLTQGIAFALLLAMVTFTSLHYLAAGFLSSGNGGAILDGAMRCAGAGVLILAWPFLYTNAVHITDAVSVALIPQDSADAPMSALLAAAGATSATGAGFLIMILFALLLLGLFMIKIGLIVGMLMAFIGMPLALAMWPVPALSAPASYVLRYIGMALSVVVMSAFCFKGFGAVDAEFKAPGGGSMGIGTKLLLPLLGIGELLALLAIPRHAVTMWNVSPRKGTIGSLAQSAASHFLGSQLGKLGKLASKSKDIKPPTGGSGQSRPPRQLPDTGPSQPPSQPPAKPVPPSPSPTGGGPNGGAPSPATASAEADAGKDEPKKVKLDTTPPGDASLSPSRNGKRGDFAPAAQAKKQSAPSRGTGRKSSTRPAQGRPGNVGGSRGPGRSSARTGGPRFEQPPRVKDSVGASAGRSSAPGGAGAGRAGPPPVNRDSKAPSRPPSSSSSQQSPPPSND